MHKGYILGLLVLFSTLAYAMEDKEKEEYVKEMLNKLNIISEKFEALGNAITKTFIQKNEQENVEKEKTTILEVDEFKLRTFFNIFNLDFSKYVTPHNLVITSKPSNDSEYPTVITISGAIKIAKNTDPFDAIKDCNEIIQNSIQPTNLDKDKIGYELMNMFSENKKSY